MSTQPKIKRFFLLPAVLCLLVVVSLAVVFVRICNWPYMARNVSNLSDQWHYHTDQDATPKPILLPSGMAGVYLNENWHLTHTLADHGENAAIMFRADYLRVIAKLDGAEIYRYGYEESYFASPGKKLVLIPLPPNYGGKEITLTLTPTMNLRAYSIFLGDEASLLAKAVGKSIPIFATGIFVLLLGFTLLCFYFIRRKKGRAITGDFWFGIFVVLVGLFLPAKSPLYLMLLSPLPAAFVSMLASYLIPCSVLLFTYTSCHKFRGSVVTALILHTAGFLPTALMQMMMNDPPTELLAFFLYLIPVYYGISVWAFARGRAGDGTETSSSASSAWTFARARAQEIESGNKKRQRLKFAGLLLIISFLADRINGVLRNPMHFSDAETFTKIGLVFFITIEVVGRIKDYFEENAQLLADFQTSQVKNRLALDHFNDVQQYMEEVRALNHDLNHHFNALKFLLEEGNPARARKYLDRLVKSYPTSKQIAHTKNQFLNYIMAYAAREAEKNNIRLTYDLNLPENIRIKDTDFYSLFINIIDNAIEACAAMENSDQRNMELACNIKNGFLYLLCKNSKNNAIVMENGKYVSTKAHEGQRGLGISIIQRIVEEYGGAVDIEYDKDWFLIKLVLKME